MEDYEIMDEGKGGIHEDPCPCIIIFFFQKKKKLYLHHISSNPHSSIPSLPNKFHSIRFAKYKNQRISLPTDQPPPPLNPNPQLSHPPLTNCLYIITAAKNLNPKKKGKRHQHLPFTRIIIMYLVRHIPVPP